MDTASSPSGPHKLLLSGIDTAECAYYLARFERGGLDFLNLEVRKERLRQSKTRNREPITLGNALFMLHGRGTASGYPFLIENGEFSVQFGEHNKPNFFVTYRSGALWQHGAAGMHQRFLAWATSVGFSPYRREALSRVDFTLDYHLPIIDFDEEHFVSLATKDNKWRENRKPQSFIFGTTPIRLRLYDKSAEILQESGKTWFYDFWGQEDHVKRIEWQVRKEALRRFALRTFDDLGDSAGDLLHYVAHDHTTLRVPNGDSNRSRWPLHPLWIDVQQQVSAASRQGVLRSIGQQKPLDERLAHINVSLYGWLKQIAAIERVRRGKADVTIAEAIERLRAGVLRIHDPLSWVHDVQKRVDDLTILKPW